MADKERPEVRAVRGDEVLAKTALWEENGIDRRQVTLCHTVHGGREWLLLDGKPVSGLAVGTAASDRFDIHLEGLKIVRYRYTKI